MTTATDTIQASPVSRRRLGIGAAVGGSVLIAALVLGAVPRMAQQQRLAAAVTAVSTVPVVSVAIVARATNSGTVALPGALTAARTAAIYARTPGYVRARFVDIGSRVRTGQLLASIDAPDLDQQAEQALAIVAQMRAATELARANLARWRALAADSAVTVQELDQMQAAFNGAVAAQGSAEANLRRLLQLQEYERVVAPFAGVITARNVDAGALVGTAGGVSEALPAGGTSAPGSLFTIAQTDTLSVYVTVPEDYAPAVATGKAAIVTVPALTGDTLRGRVARTAASLDAVARTLLTEVRVANPTGVFLPGMYADVQLAIGAGVPPLSVPATALVIRDGPPQVVIVDADSTVHYRTVSIGRDHGSWVEVTGGLTEGASIVVNPSEDLQESARVRVAGVAAGADQHPAPPAVTRDQ